jgi:hypothetical protein
LENLDKLETMRRLIYIDYNIERFTKTASKYVDNITNLSTAVKKIEDA